jgi:hypothetical protein
MCSKMQWRLHFYCNMVFYFELFRVNYYAFLLLLWQHELKQLVAVNRYV